LRPNLGKWISQAHNCAGILKSAEPGPIVHAIGSLAAGGSERQLRTVVANMQAKVNGISILCMNPKDESTDFFARELSSNRVAVTWDVGGRHDRFFASQPVFQCVRQLEAGSLPREVIDTAWGFVSQFERLKPSVVHCWLDFTNVTAGLAAVLCGVPR